MKPIKFISAVNVPQPHESENQYDSESGENIEHDPKITFEINQEAIDLLNTIQEPLCIISIAGVYRSGKSFILNQLAGYQDGFNIGSTVEPCTQGIWMWLIEDDKRPRGPEGCRYLLLDSEGLGSYIKTESYDVQIFALALLIGSYFIYNGLSSIDEGSIDKLSLVVQLTKHIRAAAEDTNEFSEASRIGMYFPKFLYLVRDFSLDLNIQGKKISPKEYLENALQPMKGDPARVGGRNQVRDFIKQFFPDRDCFTLKRPVADENQLQNLGSLPPSSFRPEYLEQVSELIDHIFRTAVPKKIHGQKLNGPMLAELTRSYIDAMNKGASLTISTAWENVVRQECQNAIASAKAGYTKHFSHSLETNDIVEENDFETFHRDAEVYANLIFREKAIGGDYWALEDELQKYVYESKDRLKVDNYIRSQQFCQKVLEEHVKLLENFLLTNKIYAMEQIEMELQRALDSFSKRAKGPAKFEVEAKLLEKKPLELSRFVHVRLIKEIKDDAEQRVQEQKERSEIEYLRIQKLYEEQVAIRKNMENLVSQLTNDNVELNRRLDKAGEDGRVLMHENQVAKKRLESHTNNRPENPQEPPKMSFTERTKQIGMDIKKNLVVDDKCIVM